MLTQLQYGADKVIFTRSNSPKAVYPQDLADMYTEICGKMCQTALSVGEAVNRQERYFPGRPVVYHGKFLSRRPGQGAVPDQVALDVFGEV